MKVRDYGKKHTCYKCSTKFYDLNKEEPLCPKCGENQNQAPRSKKKKKASSSGRKGFTGGDDFQSLPEEDDDFPDEKIEPLEIDDNAY